MNEPADLLVAKLDSALDDWPVKARPILAQALEDAIEAGADAAWERWASAVEVAMAALEEANGLARRPALKFGAACAAVERVTQTAMDQIREKAAAPPMIPVQVKRDGVWLDFGNGRQIRLMDLLSGSGMDVWEKLGTYQDDLMAECARRKARREGGDR